MCEHIWTYSPVQSYIQGTRQWWILQVKWSYCYQNMTKWFHHLPFTNRKEGHWASLLTKWVGKAIVRSLIYFGMCPWWLIEPEMSNLFWMKHQLWHLWVQYIWNGSPMVVDMYNSLLEQIYMSLSSFLILPEKYYEVFALVLTSFHCWATTNTKATSHTTQNTKFIIPTFEVFLSFRVYRLKKIFTLIPYSRWILSPIWDMGDHCACCHLF